MARSRGEAILRRRADVKLRATIRRSHRRQAAKLATHTGRLIAVTILARFAIIALLNGYWMGFTFWILITFAVGYPFVRGGKIDLNYDPDPAKMILVNPGQA